MRKIEIMMAWLILALLVVITIVMVTGCSEYTECADRCAYKRDKVIEGECYCKVKDDWQRRP